MKNWFYLLSAVMLCLELGLGQIAKATEATAEVTNVQAAKGMDGEVILSALQKSVQKQNFVLYLTKGIAGQLEPMQFSHGLVDGHEYTRWLYLDNAPSGYYTKDDWIVYFSNGTEKMSVGKGRLPGALPRLLAVEAKRIINSYQPVILGDIRAAGRSALGLKLMPRWNDRYSYVLAIDKKTFLPLSVQVFNPAYGRVESYSGVYLWTGDEPSTDIKLLAQNARDNQEVTNNMTSYVSFGWKISYIPEGFKRVFSASYALGNYGSEVEHVLYSDGLADFSVYKLKTLESMEFPIVKQGGTNLYRHRLSDYEIIVVGDLPFDTEKKIAESYVKQ